MSKDENLAGVTAVPTNCSSKMTGGWPISLLIFSLLFAGTGVRCVLGQQQGLYTEQGQTPSLLPQVFQPAVTTGVASTDTTSPGTPNTIDLSNPSVNAYGQANAAAMQNLAHGQQIQSEAVRNQQRVLNLQRQAALT